MGSNNSRSARTAEPDTLTRKHPMRCEKCGAHPSSENNGLELVSSQSEDQSADPVLSDFPTPTRRQGLLEDDSSIGGTLSEHTDPIQPTQVCNTPADDGAQQLTTHFPPYLQTLLDSPSQGSFEKALLHRKLRIFEELCLEHHELVAELDTLLRDKRVRNHPSFPNEIQLNRTLGIGYMEQVCEGGKVPIQSFSWINEEMVKIIIKITCWLAQQV